MLLRQPSANRSAGTAILTLFMLLPLLLMVAFAIDLNYVWCTDTELQNAADAAALAGASQLMVGGQAAPTGLSPTVFAQLQQTAATNATTTAQTYGQMHRAGGVQLVVNSSDVVVGYIADPTADPNTTQGQFQTDSSNFPNAVQVTVRRDASVSTGPLTLFFGGIFGTPSCNCQATSIATVRTQNITGFKGSGSSLLPLAIDQATYNAMRGNGPAPAGVVSQDLYTVNVPAQSGLTPPANVVKTPDNILEYTIYPNSTAPGNFGLVALTNGSGSKAAIANWLQYGPTSGDLASFSTQGLQATAAAPLTVHGSPGLAVGQFDAPFKTIIGQPRTLLIYSSYDGQGNNTTYQVVGFVGATIVEADLKGGTPYVVIQLSLTMDRTATQTSGVAGSANLVYSGVSVTR